MSFPRGSGAFPHGLCFSPCLTAAEANGHKAVLNAQALGSRRGRLHVVHGVTKLSHLTRGVEALLSCVKRGPRSAEVFPELRVQLIRQRPLS